MKQFLADRIKVALMLQCCICRRLWRYVLWLTGAY